MKLFTQYDYAKLLENGKPENEDKDHYPVVKLIAPDAGWTCLLTQLVDLDTAFGLCDAGTGFPELRYVYIPEIVALCGTLGFSLKRDLHFKAKFPLTFYAEAASYHGRIVEDIGILKENKY